MPVELVDLVVRLLSEGQVQGAGLVLVLLALVRLFPSVSSGMRARAGTYGKQGVCIIGAYPITCVVGLDRNKHSASRNAKLLELMRNTVKVR